MRIGFIFMPIGLISDAHRLICFTLVIFINHPSEDSTHALRYEQRSVGEISGLR